MKDWGAYDGGALFILMHKVQIPIVLARESFLAPLKHWTIIERRVQRREKQFSTGAAIRSNELENCELLNIQQSSIKTFYMHSLSLVKQKAFLFQPRLLRSLLPFPPLAEVVRWGIFSAQQWVKVFASSEFFSPFLRSPSGLGSSEWTKARTKTLPSQAKTKHELNTLHESFIIL